MTGTDVADEDRLVTFCLPPLWGTFAMRWLNQQSNL